MSAGNGDSKAAANIGHSLMNFGRWLTHEDAYSDIIISSRIRLARNLSGFKFPNRSNRDDALKVIDKVRDACQQCQTLSKAQFYDIEKLSTWDRKYFVERRLASPQLIEGEVDALLIIGANESLSIMVNEEDHLRIQAIEAGLGVREAWRLISTVEDELEEHLRFSFTAKLGYLTACPTNLGTGLRVSIFVHLPALAMSDKVNAVISELPTSEIAVRGFYGEGSESVANIFQVSNQLTLGRTEENALELILRVAEKLSVLEREAREELLQDDPVKLEDMVFRALGILRNARIVTSLEAMNLISTLRLGCEVGMVEDISRLALNQLMLLVQPAHLQKIYNEELSPQDRDITRANFIRENLNI